MTKYAISTLFLFLASSSFVSCLLTSIAVKSTSSITSPNCETNFPGVAQSAVNSKDNLSTNEESTDHDREQGKTGWNHNLPSPSSEFWSGDSPSKRREEPPTSIHGNRERTGWLHNKKPVSTNTKEKSKNNTKGINQAQRLLQMEKMKQKLNHRIIAPPTFHACGEDRCAVITEHLIAVPLNHIASQNKPKEIDRAELMINVYFSVVDLISTPEEELFFQSIQDRSKNNKCHGVLEQQRRASAYKEFFKFKDAKKFCLYLQGGPGFGAPQPIADIGLADKSSWIGAALGKGFKRIVLMDQRGTGRSTPITKQSLQKQFPGLFALDMFSAFSGRKLQCLTVDEIEAQLQLFDRTHAEDVAKFRESIYLAVEYLSQFRADNIVKDAELVKDSLLVNLPEENEYVARPWGCAIGQSFGGFCMMSYISLIRHPPSICLFTGGIAPMLTPIDDVYTRLRERVIKRNLIYYDRYPGDVAAVKRIVNYLMDKPAVLPSGGILTARRFLQVGISLGSSPSAFASLHSLFSSAFLSENDDDLSRSFLKRIDTMQPFDDHPLYFLLHESIYVDGSKHSNSSDWAGYRAFRNQSQFNYSVSSKQDSDNDPTLLFGEVVFPWMADGDYAELSGMGMRSLAHSLSSKDDWGELYDAQKMRNVMAGGATRAAAAVYYDDMYVDFNSSIEVTRWGGPLEKCKIWITNEYQHSGLRDDGATIFCKLLGMAKGAIGTPS